jgi:Ca2+-binding EF-hand superfamily protein
VQHQAAVVGVRNGSTVRATTEEEMAHMFCVFDANDDGRISWSELAALFVSPRFRPTPSHTDFAPLPPTQI